MLKEYVLPDGRTFQFEEGEQPSSAVEVAEKPAEKAKMPKNKAAEGTKTK